MATRLGEGGGGTRRIDPKTGIPQNSTTTPYIPPTAAMPAGPSAMPGRPPQMQFQPSPGQKVAAPTPSQPSQQTPTNNLGAMSTGTGINNFQNSSQNPYSYQSPLYQQNPGGIPGSQFLGQLTADNPNQSFIGANMNSYYNQNGNSPSILDSGLQQQSMQSMDTPARYPDPNNPQSYYGKSIYSLIGG